LEWRLRPTPGCSAIEEEEEVFQKFYSFLTERQISLKVDNFLEVCIVSVHNIKLQAINPEPVKSSSNDSCSQNLKPIMS
jgi:hypothetical protein